MRTKTAFSSDGLSVVEYHCDSGPDDAPFEECHSTFTLSFVTSGSFGYRRREHSYQLVAGSLLIGHAGDEYVCSHKYGCGDNCLSFEFSAEALDMVPTNRRLRELSVVPPASRIMVLGEMAGAAINGTSDVALDEIAWICLERLTRSLAGGPAVPALIADIDRRRAVQAALWIEEHATEPLTLGAMARQARLSPFYFLRIFSRVLGVTPHQYLVRCRVRLAARRLAAADSPVTDIAFESGFGDLSNFVRTFHSAAGVSPRAFRRAARGDRKILQERIRTATVAS